VPHPLNCKGGFFREIDAHESSNREKCNLPLYRTFVRVNCIARRATFESVRFKFDEGKEATNMKGRVCISEGSAAPCGADELGVELARWYHPAT
jgi:hypothetical protein